MANAPVAVKQTAPPAANAPDTWHSFRTEMDRLFDRFAGWNMRPFGHMFETSNGNGALTPVVDITETDTAYEMTAELPGMTEKEIELLLSGDMLTLKGEKRYEKEQNDENFHLSERSYGTFLRSFAVPDGVDRDKVSADVGNGVLTVILPKTAKAMEQQRQIEVKAAA
jgi:HSP20 family protein